MNIVRAAYKQGKKDGYAMSKHLIILTGLMIVVLTGLVILVTAPAKKTTEAEKWNPTAEVFDFSGKLPPKYNGTSAAGLIRWIETKGLNKKGEFEKQAEFERRVADEMKILGGKLFAFRIDTYGVLYGGFDADKKVFLPESSIGTFFNYEVRYKVFDPDKEAFLPDSSVRIVFGPDDAATFETEELGTMLGTYIGQNAYGASAEVKKLLVEKYGIRIRRKDFLESKMFAESGFGNLRLNELKMPIDRARTIGAENIAFLAVGSIDAPDVKERFHCVTPTVESPVEGCINEKYVLLKVRKFVLYDFNSGEVLYDSAK